jgi:hypothetical protein
MLIFKSFILNGLELFIQAPAWLFRGFVQKGSNSDDIDAVAAPAGGSAQTKTPAVANREGWGARDCGGLGGRRSERSE